MPRLRSVILLLMVLSIAIIPLSVGASHNRDVHSPNMSLVASVPKSGPPAGASGSITQSDLAFWGSTVFAGNYGGFRILDASNPAAPTVISDVTCPGAQGDVSIWRNLLFVSVDGPRSNPNCGAPPSALSEDLAGTSWEGIRIFDVSNPASPTPVTMVFTGCGSHTHTLVPDEANNRVFIYVSSYSLGAPTPRCNQLQHTKISVIEVPLAAPQDARVVGTPSVGTAPLPIGCHDIQAFLPLRIAASACLTEGQIWDIADPGKPTLRTRILNPAIQIWHSATFTWDGEVVVFGDEFGGGGAPGCQTGSGPIGALWFYRRSALTGTVAPAQPLGFFAIPRGQGSETCTAHNFNVIPVTDRYLLVSSWYGGGTTIVDFTTPASARQVAFYDAQEGVRAATWSSYWYNGKIYANDIARGVEVFAFDDKASVEGATFERMNPQTQEAIQPPGQAAAGLPAQQQPPAGPLAATGGGTPAVVLGIVALILAAGTLRLARSWAVGSA